VNAARGRVSLGPRSLPAALALRRVCAGFRHVPDAG
jgi:hypothetical protein